MGGGWFSDKQTKASGWSFLRMWEAGVPGFVLCLGRGRPQFSGEASFYSSSSLSGGTWATAAVEPTERCEHGGGVLCTLHSLSPPSGHRAHGWYGCHQLVVFIFDFFRCTWSQLSGQTHFAFLNLAWFVTPMLKWDLREGLVSALTQKFQLCLFDDKIKTVFKQRGERAHAKQGWAPLLQRLLGRRPPSPHLYEMERCLDHLAKL